MKIAMVGLGYWGPKLLRNLVTLVGAESVVAVDANVAAIDAARPAYPGVTFLTSLDDALADDEVEAVVLATPVETHARLGAKAMRAGCHVLVEKPLAASGAEAEELLAIAEQERRVLMVGHTFLFSPRMEAMQAAIATGKLGRVHYATSSRLNLGLYRSDANVIWDLGPHDVSIVLHLLNEYPALVQTTAQCIARRGVPDVAFMNLTFPSGAIAAVDVSWLAPRKVRSTVLVGERSMITWDDTQLDEPVKIYDKGVVTTDPDTDNFGEHQLTYRVGDTISPYVGSQEPLSAELEHFLECAREGRSGRSDGRFGLQVVNVLEGAERSWRLGGVPVELPALDAPVPRRASATSV